jgi:hypothetical protein
VLVGLAWTLSCAAQVEDLTYETNNGTITITGYTGDFQMLTIPGIIDGLPVTRIGAGAFAYFGAWYGPLYGTVETEIPFGVTNIGDGAFAFAWGIRHIAIPASVTHIGREAFYGCEILSGPVIPASVTSFGCDAFNDPEPIQKAVFFYGNSPAVSCTGSGPNASLVTIYHLRSATGWGSTWAGYPTAVWDPDMVPANGGVMGRQPAFSWSSVGPPIWFQLWINRNGQKYLSQWVSGRTNWTPAAPEGFPGGNYQWWVRPWEARAGYGKWAGPASFSVPTATPGTLEQISPKGMQGGHELAYRWIKEVGASWYHLWVGRTGAGTWLDRWFFGPGAGSGEVAPGGSHPGPSKPMQLTPLGSIMTNRPTFLWKDSGDCNWWVQGWSPDGYGPWSGPMEFSIPSPTGTWYRLYVGRGAVRIIDQWLQSTALISPLTLSSGTHSWWLGVWDAQQSRTIWSERVDFTVP